MDPLLSDLSPAATLEALEAVDAVDVVSPGDKITQDALRESVAAASRSDRALGIRAALAGKKLREWNQELASWPWPESSISDCNGFEPPVSGELASDVRWHDYSDCEDSTRSHSIAEWRGEVENGNYYGGMPEQQVQDYEDRVEAIKNDIDALGVEELKEFVRDAHLAPNPRRLSRWSDGDGVSGNVYNHLDAFTAVITATIMQFLPIISSLNVLLSNWSIRLLVLRQVPGFLKQMKESTNEMKDAWKVIEGPDTTLGPETLVIIEESLSSKRAALENRIINLGRRLDTMLDILEGKEDTIPDRWIESMEEVETEFGDWVVESEKKLMVMRWGIHQENGKIDIAIEQTGTTVADTLQPTLNSPNETLINAIPGEEARETNAVQKFATNRSSSFKSLGSDGLRHDESDDSGEPDISRLLVSNKDSSKVPGLIMDEETISEKDMPDHHSCHDGVKIAHTETMESYRANDSLSIRINQEKEERIERFKAEDSCAPKSASANNLQATENNSYVSREANASELGPSRLGREIHHPKKFRQPLEPASSAGPASLGSSSIGSGNLLRRELTKNFPITKPALFHITPESSPPSSPEVWLQRNCKEKLPTTPRPAPLVLRKENSIPESNLSSEISSDTSHPGSGTSEYFSNRSSPEIQQASMAEYFENPVQVSTPSKVPSTPQPTISRQSSQLTERGDNMISAGEVLPNEDSNPRLHRRASSFVPEMSTFKIKGLGDERSIRHDYFMSHSRVRSASLRSFEIIPRNEVRTLTWIGQLPAAYHDDQVRNITISRKGSQLPDPTLDDSIIDNEIPSAFFQEPAIPPDLIEVGLEPYNHNSSDVDSSDSAFEPDSGPENTKKVVSAGDPPSLLSRSHHRFEIVSDLSSGSTPVKLRRRKPANVMKANKDSRKNSSHIISPTPKNTEDQLEARISSILTEIPGQIRLKSGPELDAPEVLPLDLLGRDSLQSQGPRTKLSRSHSSVHSPRLTLAPANSKTSRSRGQDGDPEIKLYHLHRSGTEMPVKLFVRLVGESGERVMVRIGGGWADLGEYLKEYAVHHGRRSLLNGKFEIQGLPQSQSLALNLNRARSSSPPTSPLSRPGSSSSRAESSQTSRRLLGSAGSFPDVDPPRTPTNPIFRSYEAATPSTDSPASLLHPPSGLSLTDEDSPLGLAGPRTRRKDVSPDKQAWVDGMLDQARKASAEKKKGAEGEIGDLGKIGGTRRVFIRSRTEG